MFLPSTAAQFVRRLITNNRDRQNIVIIIADAGFRRPLLPRQESALTRALAAHFRGRHDLFGQGKHIERVAGAGLVDLGEDARQQR